MGKQRKQFLKAIDLLCRVHAILGLGETKAKDPDQAYRYQVAAQLINAALEVLDPTTEVHHGQEKAK